MARFGNLPPDRIDFLRNAADRGGSSRMGSSTAALNFPLLFPPTLLSVTPSTGPSAGGTAVILGGLNFQPGATVTFGGVAATSIVWNGPSSISCVTPAHASGAVNVVVTNPDSQSSTLVNGYTYQLKILIAGSLTTNKFARSTDGGLTWTTGLITTNGVKSILWDGTRFVAIGTQASVSSDGLSWVDTVASLTTSNLIPQGSLFSPLAGLYVTPSIFPQRSIDAATWVTAATAASGNAIGYNGNLFVAVGGTGRYSADANTWTNGLGWGSAVANAVAWNGIKFFAVGSSPATATRVSTDGISWTSGGTMPVVPAGGTIGLAWSPPLGLFCIVGVTTAPLGVAMTTPDGLTITSQTIPNQSYGGVCWDGSQFVAVAANGNATSPDGVNWTANAMPAGAWNIVTANKLPFNNP